MVQHTDYVNGFLSILYGSDRIWLIQLHRRAVIGQFTGVRKLELCIAATA